jgi:hypothetical protein
MVPNDTIDLFVPCDDDSHNHNNNNQAEPVVVIPPIVHVPLRKTLPTTFDSHLNRQRRPKFTNPWTAIVPSPFSFFLSSSSPSLDVRVEWTDPCQGARDMILACPSFLHHHDDMAVMHQAQEQLQESLQTFQQFCQDHHHHIINILSDDDDDDPLVRMTFRARLVATRGRAGTKCPRWHMDHVPVRWIQALVGKGCDYVVGETGIHRSLVNHFLEEEQDDDDDEEEDHDHQECTANNVNDRHEHTLGQANVRDRPIAKLQQQANTNTQLVNPAVANIQQAKEGHAMLLLGTRWRLLPPVDDDPHHPSNLLPNPAIHKSPTLWPGEPRVLLTLDVAL